MTNEYVKFAADIGKRLALCKGHVPSDEGAGVEEREKKPGLVRRAVNFPSLMLTAGFPSAFTFYLSKVEDYGKLKGILKYIKSDEKSLNNDENYFKVMCGELKREEGAGYAGYISILLEALRKIGKPVPSLESLPDDELYAQLLDLADNVDFKDERLLLPYLYELKKVLEALPL